MRHTICLLASIALTLFSATAQAARRTPGYHEIKKIAVGGDGGWDYLTIDGAGRRLYIARSNRVTVVDVEKGAVVGEIPNTPGVHGVALVPKLNRGFSSNGGDNTVTEFDLKTLKEVARISVGTRPDAILFDPATNRVFTFNGGSNDSTAIDAATGKVAGTVPLAGRPEFPTTDEKGRIFVNIEDKSEIVAFDAQALTVKNRWSIAPGDGPSGMSIDRKNHRVFSVCGNEMMVVLDTVSGKVVATPAIGKGPDASAFDPKEGLAVSSNGADGTLTLVKEESPNSFKVAATVPTQRGARTMALDPRSHRIYLVTAQFGPPPPDGQRRRPSVLPNTFVVLVYGPTQ